MSALAPPLIHEPRGGLPVVLSIPHSGRDYRPWLVDLAIGGRDALFTLEDPLVDRLAWRAIAQGVGAVVTQAPRAAIDCNRAEDEVDPAVVRNCRPGPLTARARGGLGVVPARTLRHGYLWQRPIDNHELQQRLDDVHRPFHRAIGTALEALLDRYGEAILIDCHSMPPPQAGVPPIVIGDRRGRSAAPWVGKAAMRIAHQSGFESRLNHPFAGGHVVERHGSPARGVHAIQVEIDRSQYLDSTLTAPGPGFDRCAQLLMRLALDLGEAVLHRQFATAAE
ncbi:MAG TPA: N-formylglutamate amidohydrolase [Sphingomicrobium sp.]|nr:N-formylglutamate amidohydrolase [Sphingomicrobium sp.]